MTGVFFANGRDRLHDNFISFGADYFFQEEMVGYPEMIFFGYVRQQFNILVLLPLKPTCSFVRGALAGLFFGLVVGKIFFFILEFHKQIIFHIPWAYLIKRIMK